MADPHLSEYLSHQFSHSAVSVHTESGFNYGIPRHASLSSRHQTQLRIYASAYTKSSAWQAG